jgi:ATP-dependent protease ClpP protease subunit
MAPTQLKPGKRPAAGYRITLRPTAVVDPDEGSEESVADVYLYAGIGGWYGVTASQFAKDWAAIADVDRINLYINSTGGEVYDGIAILNVIRRTKAYVRIQVDGIAASAASFIAMGGDELVMARNSELMIHDASAFAWGNAEQLAKESAVLDRLSQNIAGVYAERAGGDVADWRAAMKAETWYSAQEAVDAGLASSIADDSDPASDPTVIDPDQDDEDLDEALDDLRSRFTYAGRAAAPAPVIPAHASAGHPGRPDSALSRLVDAVPASPPKPPAPPVDVAHREKGAGPMPELKKGLRARLGIPADAQLDDDGLLAAVNEALDRPAPATAPTGTALIDEGALAQLQQDAAAGREARTEQVAAARTAAVDAAVHDGRIPPARREHWLTQLEADPGAAEVLNQLPKDTIPLTARGVTGGVDQSSDDDHLYTKAWGDPATNEEG